MQRGGNIYTSKVWAQNFHISDPCSSWIAPFPPQLKHQQELTAPVHDDVGGEYIDIIPPASHARTVPVEHARGTDCVEAIDVDVAGSLNGDDA